MASGLTLGHLVALTGFAILLYGLVHLVAWARYRGPQHGRGTPGYARARDGRRYALWSFVAGAFLIALGLLTPLRAIAIA